MRNFSLSIFFPTYNEEANIRDSVVQALQVASQITSDFEIIIVNDGSTDATGQIANKLSETHPNVRVIHHDRNFGYGAAVWSGIQASTKEYIFFTDADLQFDLSEVTKLAAYVPEYDAVLGYRAKRQDPFMRRLNGFGWNMLNRVFFGLFVKDVDCAFKLFKRDVVKDLPVQSRGAMLSAEMLIRLQREGIAFKEVPVTHLPRKAGSPTGAKISVIVRAFKELISVYTKELGDPRVVMLTKFLFFGLLNTAVDWLWYYSLTRSVSFFATHLIAAKALAFIIGSIPILVTNAYWVFPQGELVTRTDLAKLYSILAAAFYINTLALTFFLSIGMWDISAVVLATAASFVWNLGVAWFLLIKDRVYIPNYQRA